MGIEPYLIASSVLGFIAQRLVRVLCPACTSLAPAPPGLVEQFGLTTPPPAQLPIGKGCAACKGTGFKGRTAIYEFLLLNPQVQQLILQRASSGEITAVAQRTGGMQRLREDGWAKILQGRTTPQEVLRVT